MKKIRVGINGFGRIGRQVFRALHQSYRDRVEVVAINDLFDAESNFHLLEYDSVYGRAHLDATVDGQDATVGDWKIHCFAERDPKQLTWGAYDVDIVVESTGIFRSAIQAAVHIENGAKKVIITAPAKYCCPLSNICYHRNSTGKARHDCTDKNISMQYMRHFMCQNATYLFIIQHF